MREGPAAPNKPWKMWAAGVRPFIGLVRAPAAIVPLFFHLLGGNSRKDESEECEYAAGRFGDCGYDRYVVRCPQPRDQGGVHCSPRGGVLADRAKAVRDKQVR